MANRVGFRARRTSPGEPRTYRLANSVRLPWGLGLAALLLLGITTVVLFSRGSERALRVPNVVLDYQEGITNEAAQSVRRGVNEGVDDLAELGVALEVAAAPTRPQLQRTLLRVSELHGRYLSLALIDASGSVVASVGTAPDLGRLELEFPVKEPGMADAVLDASGDALMIPQFAPARVGGDRWTVLGLYDPGFLRFPLEPTLPGSGWVVNRDGLVLGGVDEAPALATLPRSSLRDAAAASGTGSGVEVVGGSLDDQEIVGYGPVSGVGPAGQLGWGVVAARAVDSFSLPETDARRQGVLFGIVLVILALIVFAWLYIVILQPVFRLQLEAERLAFGDLSKPVEVVRYDEIGLVARALERVRILLIRKRAAPTPKE